MSKRIEQVDKVVGQNIRIFRNAKGISQTELGSEIGVTFQQVQKYETGINRVGSSRLAKIAKVLRRKCLTAGASSWTEVTTRSQGS